ncbi:MAG: shikimate dehydrogenase [Pseudomonadales bacterium]|jgi:shikimate dehydrogenase
MKKFLVLGNPIKHSQSPAIHQQFAQQLGLEISYDKAEVPLDDFANFVKTFFAEGGEGLNVTLPFKEQTFALADVVSPSAKAARAANTLKMKNGELHAYNTDGRGILQDITHRLGWSVRDKRILIVGAGGAVRGILQPLLSASPEEVVIVNRTLEKAQKLAAEFGVYAQPIDQIEGSFDLIINATSAGLDGSDITLPATIVTAQTQCYDMLYQVAETPFMVWAKRCGVNEVSNGLGMLVEQAALSFNIWHNQAPDTRPVFDAIREKLKL